MNAFPKHHPSGKFGLFHPSRKVPLSAQKYFQQRVLNVDDRFAKDGGYLFMAQHYTERNAIERKISLSGQLGTPSGTREDRVNAMPINDAFSVFTEIRGTPKYWQKGRNEMLAKMQQLGPFIYSLP